MFNKKKWGRLSQRYEKKAPHAAVTLPKRHHRIAHKNISPNAIKVLKRLHKAGFSAYLVGGSVRDLMLKRHPKDFDIATDATPEEARAIFRNSRMIGRRFRLLHVYYPGEILEVSTFRTGGGEITRDDDGDMPDMIRRDNTYGTIEEDAWRRDFTVNAMYFDFATDTVIDYTGGVLDLKKQQIRMIGDPVQRYHEDPVRMLRAIRLAAKLDFSIDPDTEAPLTELSDLLQHVPPARIFDELLKLFFVGFAATTYQRLEKYDFINVLFPTTVNALNKGKNAAWEKFIQLALAETDHRFKKGKSLNPGFLLSVILWAPFRNRIKQLKKKGKRPAQSLHMAMNDVLKEQTSHVMIPRRLVAMIKAIWMLQFHMERLRPNRVWRIAEHRYFRAAQDFMSLRAKAGEPLKDLSEWWSKFRHENSSGRRKLLSQLEKE